MRYSPFELMRTRARPANILSRTITWVIGICALGQGCMMFWGGERRFAGPGYTVVRQVMDANHWGAFILAGGILVCTGSATRTYWVKALGMFVASLWAFAFCVGSIWTITVVPNSGVTGVCTYLGAGIVTALMAFVDERRRV